MFSHPLVAERNPVNPYTTYGTVYSVPQRLPFIRRALIDFKDLCPEQRAEKWPDVLPATSSEVAKFDKF